MEKTPPRSKLSCKSTKSKTEIRIDSNPSGSNINIVETNLKTDQENDYSPIYFPTTQESNEDIDVLWDWHSPQTSKKRRKKHLIPVQSPSFPIKRYPSNNNQNFEKLRDELKLLQEELALPDESCLCVSPQQEMEFKHDNQSGTALQLEKEQDYQFNSFNDIFDDSVDEQLVLFSQKIENDLLEKGQNNQLEVNRTDYISICDNTDIDDLIKKYSENNCNNFKHETSDNRFNAALSNVQGKNSDIRSKKCKMPFQRTYSDDHDSKNTPKMIQRMSDNLKIHRTKSFEAELETTNNLQVNISKNKLQEIERKRLEALAKLNLKKKQEINKNSPTQSSPPKCSPREIEKKRLQALAKREAKRLEEIVEKKRQEALKRLQATRMKNANPVKGH